MEPNKPTTHENTETIKGSHHPTKDFKMEPNGYFLIRINRPLEQLEAAFCKKNNVIDKVITGKTAEEVYHTILRLNLVSLKEHAAYLGKELEKAELALTLNLEYVQDRPLDTILLNRALKKLAGKQKKK